MTRFWRRRVRRLRANLHYLRQPFLEFLPLLSVLGLLLLLGGYSFHRLYRYESLTFARALYITYCLVFMEHLIRFPDHWLLRLFYFGLPPLGLVVILDGFVRFGYRVFRRTDQEPEWVRAMAKTYRDHVILCGLGRVGLRALQQLVQLGEDVLVLEKDADNPKIVAARRLGVPVLVGNGRQPETLSDLNLAAAKSIILATDDDLANLEMALDARKINPDIQVVLRMFDQELASKIREAFGIPLAISTASLAAPLFATCSSDHSIENAFYVGEQLLVVARFAVEPDSALDRRSIRELASAYPVFFLEHERDATSTHFPPGDVTLQAGDRVAVQTDPEVLKTLHGRNRPSRHVR